MCLSIIVVIPGMVFIQLMEILLALTSHGTFRKEDPAGDIDDSFRIQASFPFGRLQSTHPPKVGRGLQPWRILQMLKSMGIKEQGLCGVLGYFFFKL